MKRTIAALALSLSLLGTGVAYAASVVVNSGDSVHVTDRASFSLSLVTPAHHPVTCAKGKPKLVHLPVQQADSPYLKLVPHLVCR